MCCGVDYVTLTKMTSTSFLRTFTPLSIPRSSSARVAAVSHLTEALPGREWGAQLTGASIECGGTRPTPSAPIPIPTHHPVAIRPPDSESTHTSHAHSELPPHVRRGPSRKMSSLAARARGAATDRVRGGTAARRLGAPTRAGSGSGGSWCRSGSPTA